MKRLLLLLALTGCDKNPGQFEGKVGYQYHTPEGLRTSVSSDYGYFDVYNVDQFSQIWKGDRVSCECKYMRSFIGGPYECRIVRKLEPKNSK